MKKYLRAWRDREDSGSIISPPSQGKTANFLIPASSPDPGPKIVVDPAIDIYQTQQEQCERLDNEVFVVCPFPSDANDILSHGHQNVDCDISDDLRKAGLISKGEKPKWDF